MYNEIIFLLSYCIYVSKLLEQLPELPNAC